MSSVNAVGREITRYPVTRSMFTAMPIASVARRRVAAYARVSTDSDEQFTSYEAQIDYYTRYIRARDDWEFVRVYTDEGISGVNTKNRDGFNEMLRDAMDGKIDLIVTKSVSRFARNTVDSLVAVRKLKEHGTEVFFEKENIWTLDSKGELLITIMSSLAQEESRSISENVTWGMRKRFADGKVSMPYKQFLGYDKGEDGRPVINEAEARIVRLIFRLFLEGRTPTGICKILQEMGIPSPAGKSKWSQTTILSMLTNEKYMGDARMQKRFTVDFLTKKMKVNEGEVDQYYVRNSHDAIISPLEFDMVQAEIERRRKMGRSYSGNDLFASRLYCGDCGSLYGQKVWHSNDPYRRMVHRCNHKFGGEVKCMTPTLAPETVQKAFLEAYSRMLGGRETVVADCEEMRIMMADCSELDEQIRVLTEEIEVVADLVRRCVQENASASLARDEYARKYNRLVVRYEQAMERVKALQEEKDRRQARDRELRVFIDLLQTAPLILDEWDAQLWNMLLEKATVYRNGRIEFEFKNGMTQVVRIEEK